MSELAVAAFAAETGSHLVAEPRSARFARFARRFDEQGYLEELRQKGIRWLPRAGQAFPRGLAAIFDPPVGVFVRGAEEADLLERAAVAIVGARSCSPYGASVARTLGRELAAAGLVVVSGLARGVDGEAHRGALEPGGTTVAVLGCGVDRVYPAAHAELARRVMERGLIVSEYAPGVEPAPWRFPARNRVIAGLAAATVVVEARERSGALITADLALEEGREVFAVPGEITSALRRGRTRSCAPVRQRLHRRPTSSRCSESRPWRTGPSSCRPLQTSCSRGYAIGRQRPTSWTRELAVPAAVVATALAELGVAALIDEQAGVYRALVAT